MASVGVNSGGALKAGKGVPGRSIWLLGLEPLELCLTGKQRMPLILHLSQVPFPLHLALAVRQAVYMISCFNVRSNSY